jgi:4-hydroxy-tetrahydrodipicolinate reductase
MNAFSSSIASPLRVLIHGSTGRMGQALVRLAGAQSELTIVGAVARTTGQRVIDGIPQYADKELDGVPAFDVAIDFSQPRGLEAVLALCVRRGAGLVSGTTGLSDDQKRLLTQAAERIALVWSSNFSLGVAVLNRLVVQAARSLPGWDCDIIEMHHTRKQDAPSGTALSLGIAAEHAGAKPRYVSIRAGDIVGEHTVQFAGQGERIELIHRATDRDIFARGALHAAARLAGRGPGTYSLGDLIE